MRMRRRTAKQTLPAMRMRRLMETQTLQAQRMPHPMATQTHRALQTHRGLQTHRALQMHRGLQTRRALQTHHPMVMRMHAATPMRRLTAMLRGDSSAMVLCTVRSGRLVTECCPRPRIRPQ
jgi:hypothetical protein